jgi:predicted HTH transcriptional regulator
MIWGICDETQNIIGTTFSPSRKKIGNEELENWLLKLLNPKINFHFFEFTIENKPLVLLEIGAAFRHPVQFQNIEYIRIGSYKKKLKDFPEKERELWRVFDKIPFEKQIAIQNIQSENVLQVLDYPLYFNSLKLPVPETRQGILNAFESDGMIKLNEAGKWDITNLGAILFANKLNDFTNLSRKAIRLIIYRNENKVETIREVSGTKGYVGGFEGLIDYIIKTLPGNEVISGALRKELPMFPALAVRELIANALIHQDFFITGTGPTIEIFSNRMEITNPGLPLVKTDRFLDSPPKSRNEALASFMRRIGICEERGSGIDKVVFETELYQLPAPVFEVTDEHTRIVLFSHREFREMYKEDKIRACYLHSCLKYVQREYMTNTTLRNRYGIDERNSAQVSRIIKDSISSELIRCFDDSVGSKARRYVPWWA